MNAQHPTSNVQRPTQTRPLNAPLGRWALGVGCWALSFLLPTLLPAAITYNSTNNCLWVIDFPEEAPATLQTLLEADQANGWGKVSRDAATDTYTVDAAIWIGDGSGYSTYFQIGDKDHPDLTLAIKGSFWIRPAAEGVKRSDGSPSVMNSLVAGDPDDASVTPQVLFDCATRGEHGIFAGWRGGNSYKTTCRLWIYNSTFAAFTPGDPNRRWGAGAYLIPGKKEEYFTQGCYATDARLINSRFSDFTGPVFYGMNTAYWDNRQRCMLPHPNRVIRDCVFENGVTPFSGHQRLSGCTFRDLTHPVNDNGSVCVWAMNCTFENNKRNWYTGGYSSRDSHFIDCRIQQQHEPMTLKRNTRANAQSGIPEYPGVRIMKTLRVKVIRGTKPVPMATVVVTGNGFVLRSEAFTGTDGMTGADPQTDAIVVAIAQHQATDDPVKPETREGFRYKVTASAGGKTASGSLLSSDFKSPLAISLP